MRDEPRDVGGDRACLAHVGLGFLGRVSKGEGLGLSETISQRQVLSLGSAPRAAQGRDEIQRRRRRALMQHLKERMLRVRGRLAPHHGCGREIDAIAVQGHRFAVALHFELLQVGRQPRQPLVIRQHGESRQTQEGAVPDAEHSHQYRQIPLERRP
jgi:hypothetical protein